MEDSSFGVVSLTIIIILFTYALAGSYFEYKHIQVIHETGLGIILGILAGGLFTYVYSGTINYIINFNQSFFFYILLPIIIFSGGYNLNKRRFFKNIFYINLFGLLGTIVTFIIIFGLTYIISQNGLIIIWGKSEQVILSTKQIMIFSATICATDSVAALTMIKPNKHPKLFSVIFGEGMVNDAVSIILFLSVELLSGNQTNMFAISFEFILLFLLEFCCSILVGLVFGVFASLLFKYARFLVQSSILEVVMIIYIGYGSFTVCELLGLSGVLSVLAAGALLSYYNIYNLSPLGQITSKISISALSLMCEAFIYLYLGLSLWILSGYQITNTIYEQPTCSWTFLLLELFICSFSRAFTIILLSMLTNLIRGKDKFTLTLKELNIIWFAGLIRGSIAYALITKLTITDINNQQERQQVEIIKTTVLFLVIITTVILGGLMPFFIKINLNTSNQIGEENEKLLDNKQSYKNKIQNKFLYYDTHYFKKWLIFKYQDTVEDEHTNSTQSQQDAITMKSTLSSKFTGNQNFIFYLNPNEKIKKTDSNLDGIENLNDQSPSTEEPDQPNLVKKINNDFNNNEFL